MVIQAENELLKQFKEALEEDEKSAATCEKYLRDVRSFLRFVGEGRTITKEIVMAYKKSLPEKYAISSAYAVKQAVLTR